MIYFMNCHQEPDFNPRKKFVNVLVLSKCYKELAEQKISPYIQDIAQDLFDEKCIISYNPFNILTHFSKYGA